MSPLRRSMPTRQPDRPGSDRFRTVYDAERGGWYPPAKSSKPDKSKDAQR